MMQQGEPCYVCGEIWPHYCTCKSMTETQEKLKPVAAIENLRNHQHQMDLEGIMVSVSRQALDEVLDYIDTRTQEARIAELEEALEFARLVAREAYEHWDNDNDSKVGKMLSALSGYLPGYMAKTDKISNALKGNTDNG